MRHAGFNQNAFGIIGLGNFGTALALSLVSSGKEVVVLEKDESRLDAVKGVIEHLYPVDQITQDVLADSGISHCGTVIVCIGQDVEENILVTLDLLEMGIPRVIARANSSGHEKVLRKIGAEVVSPESDMGVRLAKSLVTLRTLDFLELDENISLAEIMLSGQIADKTLAQLNFRKRFKLNIIAVTHEDKTEVEIDPETVLHKGDEIVVIGKNEDLAAFQKFNSRL
jgi:trk system potassium uptake protein TrkA